MTEQPDMDLPDGGKSYKLVAEGAESTVVAEYEPSHGRETAYQSEADLEEELLRILESQGYERLSAHTESELIANLRTQLEKLNDVRFTDNEWSHFFHEVIASSTAGIEDKTRLIQEDNIQILNRDDGTTKNIRLIDKVHVHSNRLQVLHQFEEEGGSHPTRYDVTILVNGLPLVQIELKRRGVAIKEAFNQINRYQRDSFWAGSGLYEYAQIFIISNGTHTKYYSNTTRFKHIHEMEGRPATGRSQKSSDSFEFTSWWADGRNHVIADLTGFARTFLARHTLLNILTRYCVFTAEHALLVMEEELFRRPTRYNEMPFVPHYDVSPDVTWLDFQRAHFNAFRDPDMFIYSFFPSLVVNKLVEEGKLQPVTNGGRDELTNEDSSRGLDSLILNNPGEYYGARPWLVNMSPYPNPLPLSIDATAEKLLREIADMLQTHHVDYLVIVPPRFRSEALLPLDHVLLCEIMGRDRVHDFSGDKALVHDLYTYYDGTHLLTHRCTELIDRSYARDDKWLTMPR